MQSEGSASASCAHSCALVARSISTSCSSDSSRSDSFCRCRRPTSRERSSRIATVRLGTADTAASSTHGEASTVVGAMLQCSTRRRLQGTTSVGWRSWAICMLFGVQENECGEYG